MTILVTLPLGRVGEGAEACLRKDTIIVKNFYKKNRKNRGL